jgi:hypothetical protein
MANLSTDKLTELRDLAEEITTTAEALIDIREAERGEYDSDDRQEANDDVVNAIEAFITAVPAWLRGKWS